jgi:hypothetical protein
VPHRPGLPRPAAAALPVLAALSVLVAVLVGPAVQAAAGEPPVPSHVPPVDAPVADAFRPPEQRWEAGNRGLKYATEPGNVVRASADGEVVFAGAVAGSLHVTVRHPDGLRTSYSFLATVDVRLGQQVVRGDPVGTSGALLHFGARVGDAYLDPASLFADERRERVRLVRFEDPPGWGIAGERSALRQLVGGALGLAGDGARWLAGEAADAGRHLAHHLVLPHTWPVQLALTAVTVVGEAQRDARRECTPAAAAPPAPAGRRLAVLVGGLGSSSERAAIDDVDVAGLGYGPADVLRFSYAGGRTPGTGPSVVDVPARPYGAADTQRDLHHSAGDLADVLEAAVAAADGAPVDVLAHSQGGVVARLALDELERRHGQEWLDSVGLLATLGTPHTGADLATAAAVWSRTTTGGHGLEVVSRLLAAGGYDLEPTSAAVRQLSEESAVSRHLVSSGVAGGVPTLSVAASGDLVVAVPRTRVQGATSVVVGLHGVTAHDALPGSDAAHRELALALGGAAPTCTSFRTSLLHRSTGALIGMATDHLAAAGTGALVYLDVRTPLQVAVPLTAADAVDLAGRLDRG